jgi:uncharacterized protein YdaT
LPWTTEQFPPAVRHLSEPAWRKAIAIAEALLAEGMDKGLAIRIAITKARECARHHGLPERDT